MLLLPHTEAIFASFPLKFLLNYTVSKVVRQTSPGNSCSPLMFVGGLSTGGEGGGEEGKAQSSGSFLGGCTRLTLLLTVLSERGSVNARVRVADTHHGPYLPPISSAPIAAPLFLNPQPE